MFTDLFINLTNLDLQKNAHTEKTEYAYQPKKKTEKNTRFTVQKYTNLHRDPMVP